MGLAIASIFLALAEQFWLAYFLLLGQFIFDGIDGRIARKFGGGKLGIYLDSFSDFTAIAAVVVLGWSIGVVNVWMYLVTFLFLVSAVVRFSFFMAHASKEKTKEFTGVPTVLAVVVIATLIMVNYKFELVEMDWLVLSYLFFSYAMIANWKIKKI